MAHLLHQLLAARAARAPDAIALVDRLGTMSYGELVRASEPVTRSLTARGVGAGTPIGLLIEKSREAVIALYGILASGGAYVPLDPTAPATRAARIARACGMTHLLLSAGQADRNLAGILADGSQIEHILLPSSPTDEQRRTAGSRAIACWADTPAAAPAGRAPRGRAAPGRTSIDLDLAYILHTSGSTGTPKGVAISHRNALCFVDMCVGFFSITERDRLASHAPFHFDLSVFDLFVAAAAGAAVVLLPPSVSAFPRKMAEWIDTHGITVWNSVASALTLLVDRGSPERASLDSLRLVLFSGELMPVRVLRRLRQHMRNAALYNIYGQTEANSSMYFRVDDIPTDDGARLPIGRAFPNFEVFALDERGQVIDRPGVEGELYVRAGTVATGYYRDPERSGQVFVADPRGGSADRVYRTGDRVVQDEHGQYLFVGRRDNLIKSRGHRIELGEVELELLACPGVERAAVVAIPDQAVGHRLHAFVSPQPQAALDAGEVVAWCGGRLPPYMVPERLDIRPALPLTSTGKVDRNALRDEIVRARAADAADGA